MLKEIFKLHYYLNNVTGDNIKTADFISGTEHIRATVLNKIKRIHSSTYSCDFLATNDMEDNMFLQSQPTFTVPSRLEVAKIPTSGHLSKAVIYEQSTSTL